VYPVDAILNALPPQQKAPIVLLDLGCGHGTFLALARRRRPDVELIGLDLSESKIDSAKAAFRASGVPVRDLAVKDIAHFPGQSVDTITIIDVLYLVPFSEWTSILQRCRDCLRPGGVLILKEMDPSIRWKFRLLYFEEFLAVRTLGLTLGSRFTFPPRDQVSALLKGIGFAVRESAVDRGYHVPHYLWVCSK